jgi:hypothetical protein
MRNARHATVLVALLALTGAAMSAQAAHGPQAASGSTPDVAVYPAASFAAAAPATAYDMISRVPGFAIVDADEDVRGYAAALGNVLIDGVRPTSKREDVEDLLKRIPAAAVDRIELIHSGTPGVDMGGYAVLANVVRRHGATVETVYEAGAAASTDGWAAPSGLAQYSRRGDGRVLDLALKYDPELDDDSGRGTIRSTGGDGSARGSSALDTRTIKGKGEATAGWQQPLAGGRLTVTAAWRGERERTHTVMTMLTPGGDGETDDETEDTRETEIGVRYRHAVAAHSRLELMASQRRDRIDDNERSREDGDDERFNQATHTGERIARAELTTQWSNRLSLHASLEGAVNTLRSDAQLREDGAAVAVPGSDVRIRENRAESDLGATWTPRDDLSLEAGLRIERSTIAQTGDSPLTRRFTYPKPRIAVRWDLDPHDQLRLSLSREVGQLDFEDFVASAELDTDQVSAGNAELQPDRTWRAVVAWERQLGDDAAVTVTWTHDRISDVIDRVLVVTPDAVFDAPGNIGDGRRDTLALDLGLPLDRIGLTGGRLRTSVQWHRSRVTDPVTGRARPISGDKPVDGEIDLTQDVPKFSLHWGITLEHLAEREAKYRYDQVERKSEGMSWTVFVEHRLGAHWRVRAEATDLFGRDFTETREKYDAPRADTPADEVERRRRTTPGQVSLTFRRSLGG